MDSRTKKRWIFAAMASLLVGLLALTSCSDDSGEPQPITGALTGGACSCDSDCNDLGNWTAFCFKGLCVLEPLDDCSSGNTACPDGTTCTEWTHGEEAVPVCALACDNDKNYPCLGSCEDGICAPTEGDNCLSGCCSVADPLVPPPETPDYPEQEWTPPACGVDTYPCPPYGTRKKRVIADIGFLPANDAAMTLAGDDGVLSLSDYYSADARLIVIFVTAGWCPYCSTEANVLNDIYESFADDERGNVMFLGVVSQDGGGYAADIDYAEGYAAGKDWTFPAVPDVNGMANRYFLQQAYPFHIFIDARNMTIQYMSHGALTSADVTNRINDMLDD